MNSLDGAKHGPQEPTILAPNAYAAPRHTPHQCVALVQGSGLHLSDELHELLRRRLRIACTICAIGFSMFLLRNMWRTTDGHEGPDAWDRALRYAMIAVLVFLSTILWTKYSFSHRTLRIIELFMFGSMAVYFADLQFRVNDPERLELLARPTDYAVSRVLALGNSANNMRWFFLIVLYGMFIPNTWKRCTIVVLCMTVTPLALTLLKCPTCAVMGPNAGNLLFSSAVFLSLSAAISIFGSYKINELQHQAFQARKLGQYQLLRKLGSGGMGDVYLGEHVLLRRACAIKLIRADQAGDPTTLSRFEREVQAMATLTHWNTVEVYDYGHAEDGTFYYVMEYLPGLSLQELVEQFGPLPAGRAIFFLRQICAALQEAHAIGLIHRDIKPSNIITCRRGNVYDVAKLLDFGLVHEIGSLGDPSSKLTIQGTILGSPNFLSPEQARGTAHVDARTDIYSLGALAYFLITGQTPFVRDTVMDLLAAHMKDDVVSPHQLRPEIPSDLEDVILMCLRKNPEERFPDAESLDLALAACDAADQWDAEKARNWWRQTAQAEPAPVASY
jgi:eukaryotic-like serine/threonine-protein kinase